MKRLILVRHGETLWHAENRYAGSSDIALTEKGVAQAQSLAQWARTADLDAVYSSPLLRARLTAEGAASAAGKPLQIEADLRELDFGQGEGKTAAEMRAAFPQARAAFELDPVTHFLPAGENPEHAADRGFAVLKAIAEKLPREGRALVVAHNTLFRLLLCRVLSVPLARYRATFPQLANGTGTELGFDGDSICLLTFNAPLTHFGRNTHS